MSLQPESFLPLPSGVQYCHTYHRPLLLASIALGYTAWLLLVLASLLPSGVQAPSNGAPRILRADAVRLPLRARAAGRAALGVLALAAAAFVATHGLPTTYYLYLLGPIFCWALALNSLDQLLAELRCGRRRK